MIKEWQQINNMSNKILADTALGMTEDLTYTYFAKDTPKIPIITFFLSKIKRY